METHIIYQSFTKNAQHRTFLVVQEWYLVHTTYPLLSTSGATAYGLYSISISYQNRYVIEGEMWYPSVGLLGRPGFTMMNQQHP